MSQSQRDAGTTPPSVAVTPAAHSPDRAAAPGPAPSNLADRPLVQHFLDRSSHHGDQVAFRYKDLGIWQEVTWAGYRDRVERLALGLASLGVGHGARVAVMASTRPEWLYAEMAVQSLGALVVGIYPTATPDELGGLLNSCEPAVIIAGDQGQLDRLAQSGHEGADAVVVIETSGAGDSGAPTAGSGVLGGSGVFCGAGGPGGRRIISYDAVDELGAALAQRDRSAWERPLAGAAPDDIVGAFCTVGTTGPPKAALLSSRNLVLALTSCFDGADPPGPNDRIVTRLPLAYVGERQLSVYAPILYGCVAHLPEDMATVGEATTEVQPTLLVGFPGEWVAAVGRVQVGIEHGDPLARSVYSLAMRARRSYRRSLSNGKRPSPLARLTSWAAYWTVCRQLLNKFGFPRLVVVLTTGAQLPGAVAERWGLWGVQLREVYSLTEAAGFAALQPQKATAGASLHTLAGIDARIAAGGELLLRGSSLFRGYSGADTGVDEEGWFHTGDLAEVADDGGLRILGRKHDVIEAGRIVVTATAVEQQLRTQPLIREAVVCLIGDGHLGALLELDPEAASSWARERGIRVAGYAGLTAAAPVREHLAEEVELANRSLAESGLPAVADHRLFPQPLDPEAGDEVTATRTVRRSAILHKYRTLIEEMGDRRVQPDGTAQAEAAAPAASSSATASSGQPQ
jgi:long-chain acyl-CoA synthetase